MVKYQDLRQKVQNLEKYEGCVRIDRSPLINPAYPGQFNVSFGEYPWLIEYGRYTDFDHDYVFSTVQSSVRWDDIYHEGTRTSKLEGDERWKYLGVFEMADLVGIITLQKRIPNLRIIGQLESRTGLNFETILAIEKAKKMVELQFLQTRTLVDLLTSLGISKERIYPSYQTGGDISKITGGKYNFDFEISADELGRRFFLELGIPQENLIPDRTRNTFLAVGLEKEASNGKGKIQIPTPWGYRNEINVNIGTRENPKYVDVATIERFVWKPVYENKKIIGLTDINDEVSICATGLERLCMVANGLSRVQDIDCIKPFYDALSNVSSSVLVGESLRALHRICADIQKYSLDLSRSRRRKVNRMMRWMVDSGLESEEISKLLKINAENQPWHPELAEAVDYTCQEIQNYTKRSVV